MFEFVRHAHVVDPPKQLSKLDPATASFWRRVFLMPGVGDDTRAQAVDFLASMFVRGGEVEAAHGADEELDP